MQGFKKVEIWSRLQIFFFPPIICFSILVILTSFFNETLSGSHPTYNNYPSGVYVSGGLLLKTGHRSEKSPGPSPDSKNRQMRVNYDFVGRLPSILLPKGMGKKSFSLTRNHYHSGTG